MKTTPETMVINKLKIIMVVAIFGAAWEDIGVWRTQPNKFELVISIDSKNYIGRDYG